MKKETKGGEKICIIPSSAKGHITRPYKDIL